MEQSRRAVESYRRSRMIEGATSDEDKVTPVYKLEEICDLLTSSHVSIVKEVAEFILKRLDHKSPIVKQKALRIIKYSVGKSGAQFRREMQRNSVAVRQLIHYKGQPDSLKGDALNRAVRQTAQEALSALFSTDESKHLTVESSLGSRIQGFGSTNYEMPSEDIKFIISDVVDIGSATIKQGLSSFMQSPSLRKNDDTGSYKSPNLRRSLTRESESSDRYEGFGSRAESHHNSRFSKNASSGNWGQDIGTPQGETSNLDSSSTYGQKTREDKLVETIVTSGGVRLQPTRDALQIFLVEASKLNALALGHAIEAKLKSPMWQVRMKAICVLEAVLRKKDDMHFSVIASYFSDNNEMVVQCFESPQASLREKANKVLSLLGGDQTSGANHVQNLTKTSQTSVVVDLIDTGDNKDLLGVEFVKKTDCEPRITHAAASTALLIDDLLGDGFGVGESAHESKLDDDAFGDVSFHPSLDKDQVADFFSGIAVNNAGVTEAPVASHNTESEPFDFLNSSSGGYQEHGSPRKDVNVLMGSMSVNGNDPFAKQSGSTAGTGSENVCSISSILPESRVSNHVLNTGFTSPATGMNANPMFPLNAMAYGSPSGLTFNQSLGSLHVNYHAMAGLVTQQQFLATMTNFQQLGNLQANTSISSVQGGHSSPLPDIFNAGMSTQPPISLMNDSKREETKAFDFVSDQLAAARGPKR